MSSSVAPIAAESVPAETSRLAPEVWGGIECTVNRVKHEYFDQAVKSGHLARPDDYQQIASLGIRTCRVGLLWEQHDRQPDWESFDRTLQQVCEAGIRPIVGLMHHGSGPPDTNLLCEDLPERLAAFAAKVASRYPWVDAYTPVNEPNTTARFSGMYGLWYPHHRSRRSYLRALLLQIKATVLSMEAIRHVVPYAELVQTEDGGRTFGTPDLQSTVDMLNERRWLPFDLLCGRVNRSHPMFSYLARSGIAGKEIEWFADHPCPPEIIGLNYYATSDRYLDERVQLYPARLRSAEGNFVDVDAVRIRTEGIVGFYELLREAWDRYHLPLALTEVHLGCTTDEQIHWINEAWQAATHARRSRIDCRALTVWALLGSYDWNTLVTRDTGHYEPGAFDVSSGTRSETALARTVREMSAGHSPARSLSLTGGWWRRPERLLFSQQATRQDLAA